MCCTVGIERGETAPFEYRSQKQAAITFPKRVFFGSIVLPHAATQTDRSCQIASGDTGDYGRLEALTQIGLAYRTSRLVIESRALQQRRE